MNCYITPKGEKSVLAPQIQQKYGSEEMDRIMSFIYTEEFISEHGDFVKGNPVGMDVNAIGEPTLGFLEGKGLFESKQVPPKQGVTELFESNPELSSIGTPEQYSQYLDTIFPDSEVKDIVYHGSSQQFDKFSKEKLSQSPVIHFSKKKDYTGWYKFNYPVLLNIKKLYDYGWLDRKEKEKDTDLPAIEGAVLDNFNESDLERLTKQGYDGAFGYGQITYEKGVPTDNLEYVVFEPEQIHILGSQADIQGFKNYISNPLKEGFIDARPGENNYQKLGKVTQSNFSGVESAGVIIVPSYPDGSNGFKGGPNTKIIEQYYGDAIVAYRPDDQALEIITDEIWAETHNDRGIPTIAREEAKELAKEHLNLKHFGNPFTKGTTEENVNSFINWVLTSSDRRAEWIRSEIKSGKLKGKPIYYGNTDANKKNVPSHATALDWLINSNESPLNSTSGEGTELKPKNIFTVEPIQSADKKAKSKAKIATQYIGFAEGIAGSSTALYAKQAGKYANTGSYSSNDVIFVSIGGKRGNEAIRKAQQDRTIREAIKALEAGATLITDNAAYVESSSYNEGEKRLAANLKAKGYVYTETTVDGNVLGAWNKANIGFSEDLSLPKIEVFSGKLTREYVTANPDKLFLFGDNTHDRTVTKYIPTSTQAQIRGLDNALGIDTKRDRGTKESSYFTDADFNEFKAHVDSVIDAALSTGKTIVIPADGIGTGKAELPTRAPKLYGYLESKLSALSNQSVLKGKLTIEENPNGSDMASSYRYRTVSNAKEADATIHIASNFDTAGEKLTRSSVEKAGKQYVQVSFDNMDKFVESTVELLNKSKATSLNLAGNGIYDLPITQKELDDQVFNFLHAVLTHPNLENKITSIRSGGQTGIDESGAKAGVRLGLKTTVLAPAGYLFRDSTNRQGKEEFVKRFEGYFTESNENSLTPTEIKQNLKNMFSESSKITKSPDERVYIKDDQELKRVTTVISPDGAMELSSDDLLSNPYGKASTVIGTYVDIIGREVFMSTKKLTKTNALKFLEGLSDLKRHLKDDEATSHMDTWKLMPDEVLLSIVKGFQSVKDALAKEGFTDFKTTDLRLASKSLGIAGEMDLIVSNPTTGQVRILDFKTMRGDKFEDGTYYSTEKVVFTGEYQTRNIEIGGKLTEASVPIYKSVVGKSDSLETKHTKQLSMYKHIMETEYNIPVEGIYVIPIILNKYNYDAMDVTEAKVRLPHQLSPLTFDEIIPKVSKQIIEESRPLAIADKKSIRKVAVPEKLLTTDASRDTNLQLLKVHLKSRYVDFARANPDLTISFPVNNPQSVEASKPFIDPALGISGRDVVDLMSEIVLAEGQDLPNNLAFFPQTWSYIQSSIIPRLLTVNDRLIETPYTLKPGLIRANKIAYEAPLVNEKMEIEEGRFLSDVYGKEVAEALVRKMVQFVSKHTFRRGYNSKKVEISRPILTSMAMMLKLKHALEAEGLSSTKLLSGVRALATDRVSYAKYNPILKQIITKLRSLGYNIKEKDEDKLRDGIHKFITKWVADGMPDITANDLKHFEHVEADVAGDKFNTAEEAEDTSEEDTIEGSDEHDEEESYAKENSEEGFRDFDAAAMERDYRKSASSKVKLWLESVPEVEGTLEGFTYLDVYNDVESGTASIDRKLSFKKSVLGETDVLDGSILMEKLIKFHNDVPGITEENLILKLISTGDKDLVAAAVAIIDSENKENFKEVRRSLLRLMNQQFKSKIKTTTVNFRESGTNKTYVSSLHFNDSISDDVKTWQEGFKYSPIAVKNPDGTFSINKEMARVNLEKVKFLGELLSLIPASFDKDFNKQQTMEDVLNTLLSSKAYTESVRSSFPELSKFITKKNYGTQGKSMYVLDTKTLADVVKPMLDEFGIVLSNDVLKEAFEPVLWKVPTNNKLEYRNIPRISTVNKGARFFYGNSFSSQFGFYKNGKPVGLFSAFFSYAAGEKRFESSEFSEDLGTKSLTDANNPMFSFGNSVLRSLATIKNKYDRLSYPKSSSFGGKKTFNIALHNNVSILLQSIKSRNEISDALEFNPLVRGYSNDIKASVGRGASISPLANEIIEGGLEVVEFMGHDNDSSSEGNARSGMSPRELYVSQLTQFFSGDEAIKPTFITLTNSDKSSTNVGYTGLSSSAIMPKTFLTPTVLSSKTTGLNIPIEVEKQIRSFIVGEFKFIKNVVNSLEKGVDIKDARIETFGVFFNKFPMFNYSYLKGKLKEQEVTSRKDSPEARLLYALYGEDITDVKEDVVINQRSLVADIDSDVISDMYEYYRDNFYLREIGIQAATIKSNVSVDEFDPNLLLKFVPGFKGEYVKEVVLSQGKFVSNAVDSNETLRHKMFYEGENVIKPREGVSEKHPYYESYRELLELGLHNYITSFIQASYVMNNTIGDMFYGSLIGSLKVPKELKGLTIEELYSPENVITLTKAMVDEFNKRLAKDIAPGVVPIVKRKTYTTINFSDDSKNEMHYQELKDMAKRMNLPNTVTSSSGLDAASYSTVNAFLEVMLGTDKLTQAQYDELMSVVDNPDSDGYYEFNNDQLEMLSFAFSGIKPVVTSFDPRFLSMGVITDTYDKVAEFPLLPQFTKGRELDKLRRFMEQNNIDRAVAESGRKRGNSSEMVEVFNNKGGVNDLSAYTSDPELMEKAKKDLYYSNYRIQLELPTEFDKQEVTTVTQAAKNLLADSMDDAIDGGPAFPGVKTGRDMQEVKDKIRQATIKLGMAKFNKDFSVSMVNEETGEISIKDSKVSDALTRSAENNNFTPNEKMLLQTNSKDRGRFFLDPFFHPKRSKFESELLSSITDIVKGFKPKGKSYVQMPSMGYQFTKEGHIELQGSTEHVGAVLLDPSIYDGKRPLKGPYIDANGDVHPAEVILPFELFSGDSKLKIEDFTTTDENGNVMIDPNKIDPAIWDVIAFRIPNQGHSSMVPMKVVGFLPSAMGDTVGVPSFVTGQMGSDFDIDKLTIYRRPYTVEKTDNGLLVGAVTPSIDRLETKLDIQAAYFEMFYRTLMSPSIMLKVTSKLDKDDLKDAAAKYDKALTKSIPSVSFMMPATQIELFNGAKDAKTMVGITASTSSLITYLEASGKDGDVIRLGKESKDGSFERKPIKFGGKELEFLNNKSNGTESDPTMTSYIANQLYLSEAVDYAKNKILDKIGANIVTIPFIDALNILKDSKGLITDPELTTAVMVQPAVREFVTGVRNGRDSFSKFSKDLIIQELRRKKFDLIKEIQVYEPEATPEQIQEKISELLAKPEKELIKILDKSKERIEGEEGTFEDTLAQVAVIDLLLRLQPVAERIGKYKAVINMDTKGATTNFIDFDKRNSIIDSLYTGNNIVHNEYLLMTKTELGSMYEMYNDYVSVMRDKILPSKAISNIKSVLSSITGKHESEFSRNDLKFIESSIKAVALSSTAIIGEGTASDIRMKLLHDGPNHKSLATRLIELKNKYPDSLFLRVINPRFNPESALGPHTIVYEGSALLEAYSTKLELEYLNLLTSGDKELQAFATDLLKYTFVSSNGKSLSSLANSIPAAALLSNKLPQRLRDFLRDIPESQDVLNEIANQIVQHKPSLAKELPRDVFKDNPNVFEGSDYPLAVEASDIWASLPEGNSDRIEFVRFRSSVEGRTILYKYNAEDEIFSVVDTLGNGGNTEFDLYYDDYTSAVSMYPKNMVARVRTPGAVTRANAHEIKSAMKYIDRLREAQDPDNALSRWGFTSIVRDSSSEVHEVLARVSSDAAVPGHLRVMGNYLRVTLKGAGNIGLLPNLSLNLGSTNSFDSRTNTISIEKTGSIHDAATALVHESTHALTSNVLTLLGFRGREFFSSDEAYDAYMDRVGPFRLENQSLYDKAMKLDSIRQRAFKEYKKSLSAEEFERIESNAANKIFEKESDLVYYYLSSPIEFIAGITEGHLQLLEVLNSFDVEMEFETGRTSLFESVMKFFREFMDAIFDLVQAPIGEKSALRAAVRLTFDIMENSTPALDPKKNLDTYGKFGFVDKSNGIYDTEEKALKAATLAAHQGYDTDVRPIQGGLYYETFVDNRHSSSGKLDPEQLFLLKKFREQERAVLATLNYSTGSSTDDTVRELHKDYLETLRDNIKAINKAVDIASIAEMAVGQLRWVKSLLSKDVDTLNTQVLVSTSEIIGLWKNIAQLSLDDPDLDLDSISDEFKELKREVEPLANEMNLHYGKLFDPILANDARGVGMTGIDFGEGTVKETLKNPDWISKEFMSIASRNQPVLQYLTGVGMEATNNLQEAMNRIAKSVDSLEELISSASKALGWTDEEVRDFMFIDDKVKGDKKYKQHKRVTLVNNELEVLKSNTLVSNRSRSTRILQDTEKSPKDKEFFYKKMAADYNKSLTSGDAIIVDLSRLLDLTTGNKSADYDAYVKELADHIGDESYAKDVVSKAVRGYKAYLKRREVRFEAIENELEELPKSLELILRSRLGLRPGDKIPANRVKEMRDVEVLNRKAFWEQSNSPITLYNQVTDSASTDAGNFHNYSFGLYSIPSKNNPKTLDPKYQKIQSTPALKAVYDHIDSILDQIIPNLPEYLRESAGKDFLPLISNLKTRNTQRYDLVSAISSVTKADTYKNLVSIEYNSVQRAKDHTKNRSTFRMDGKIVMKSNDVTDQSKASARDISSQLEAFALEVFKNKFLLPFDQIAGVIEGYIVDNSASSMMKGGKGLNNLAELVRHYRDFSTGNRESTKSMDSKVVVYSFNPSENKAIGKEVEKLEEEIEDLLDKVANDASTQGKGWKFVNKGGGVIDKVESEDLKNLTTKRARLREIHEKARYLSPTQAGKSLLKFNMYKTLAMNPISGFINFTQGFNALTAFAAGGVLDEGTQFSKSEVSKYHVRKAFGALKGNMASSALSLFNYDGGPISEKNRNFLERIGLIDNYIDLIGGKQITSKEERTYFKRNFDLMGWQRNGDFLNKAALAIAMAMNTKVIVTRKDDGRQVEVNLYDALDSNGEWDTSIYEYDPSWDIGSRTEWVKFRDRVRLTSLRVFGNQDRNLAPKYRDNIILSLVGQFRASWMPDMIQSRWGDRSNSGLLGKEVEGRYRTLLRTRQNAFSALYRAATSVMFGKKSINDIQIYDNGQKRQIQTWEVENLRRDVVGLMYTMLAMGTFYSIGLLLKYGLDDDDDEMKSAAYLAMNMSYRVQQDLLFFSSPSSAKNLTTSIIPSLKVFTDVTDAVPKYWDIMTDEDKDFNYKNGIKPVLKNLPVLRQYPLMETYTSKDLSTMKF